MHILLVEDDINLGQGIKTLLEIDGYEVNLATTGTEAIEEIKYGTSQYDVVLLDWMLPELSGLEVCKWLRDIKKGHYNGGIIFLTAKSELDDCVQALEVGADDYLTKPFHFEELEARIRSLTRRKFIQENVCLKWGQLTFDTRTRKASVNNETLSLTRKESALLEYFLLHQNRIISPEELIEHIWDGSVNSFSNSIRVHISSLRKKLRASMGKDPIQNKVGQGYILTEELR